MITVISVYMHILLKQFVMLFFPLWLWRWPIIPISMSWLTYTLRVCVITCFMIYAFLSGCCVFEITSIDDWQQYWTYYHIELTIRHSHGSIRSLFFSFRKVNEINQEIKSRTSFFFNDQEWSYYFVANTTDISNAK